MNLTRAYQIASISANRAQSDRFVVLDCDNTYQVGTVFALDTWLAGLPVVATFGPDGQLIRE